MPIRTTCNGRHYLSLRFADDGHQVGYFAEGDESVWLQWRLFGRGSEWKSPHYQPQQKGLDQTKLNTAGDESVPGHHDVSAKEMLSGFEDFRVS